LIAKKFDGGNMSLNLLYSFNIKFGNNCLRGNSVRVVLSPTTSGALRGGLTRALDGSEKTVRLFTSNLQSTNAVVADIAGGASTTDHGVIDFTDDEPGEVLEFVSLQDTSIYDSYKADSMLADFLSRPVLLRTYTWAVGGALDSTFYPWEEFFDHVAIKRKVENYNFINCTMRIKVLINTSPFYYGLAGLFYEPMADLGPCPIVETATYDGFLVPLSQRPHIWIHPETSAGGEMTLPFFYNRNWLDITHKQGMRDMGNFNLRSFTNLLNANAVAGTDCSVQIFAWAENVSICGPTYNAALQSTDHKHQPPAVSSIGSRSLKMHQALEGGDHYEHAGKISKPASAIARAAGTIATGATMGAGLAAAEGNLVMAAGFETVALGATATNVVANVVAATATAFGYTNTPNIVGVAPYKSLPFHSMASAEISQPVEKLTLDPKNELLVDGTITGITAEEELVIDSIARRESWIYTSAWSAARPPGYILFGSLVRPELLRRDGSSNYKYQLTPLAMLQNLFTYWRGDVVFRFRFVCSQYHRGRVRITWDPSDNLNAVTDSMTTNYNRIVDIAAEPDVRIKIPYLQATSWLKTTIDKTQVFSDDSVTLLNPDKHLDNGQITVRVFTQQTSPTASADIQLIVSVYGEGMEFAAPKDIPQDYSFYALQSTDVPVEVNSSTPLFPANPPSKDINMIYMGENITSLKQLLRRRVYTTSTSIDANATDNVLQRLSLKFNRLPKYYGYDTDGYHDAVDTIGISDSKFNFVKVTPFTWIGSCFVGCRGSINWDFNVASPEAIQHMRVIRKPSTITATDYVDSIIVAAARTESLVARACLVNTESGSTGASLLHQRTQTGLSVNAPMYNRYRFRGVSAISRNLGQTADDSDLDNLELEVWMSPGGGQNPGHMKVDMYTGIGPDFDFHFFLNIPTLYELASTPFAP